MKEQFYEPDCANCEKKKAYAITSDFHWLDWEDCPLRCSEREKRIKTMLKPCPFCGSDKLCFSEVDHWPAIVCETCLVGVSGAPDRETLIDMWNYRRERNNEDKTR